MDIEKAKKIQKYFELIRIILLIIILLFVFIGLIKVQT